MSEANSTEHLKTSSNPQIQEKVEEKVKDLRGLKRYKTTSTEELNTKARSMVAYEMWLKKNTEKLTKRHGVELITKDQELEAAKQESEVDELTGLPNLRAFNRKHAEEINRIRRDRIRRPDAEAKVSIIVLDVDDFKRLNDEKGHKAGDAQLLDVAEALTSGTRRDTDFIFRLHGDEFAIILPETDTKGAFKMWQETLNPEFISRGISISGGTAELDPEHAQDGFKKADRAMYGAKKHSEVTGENLLESYVLENTNG